MSARYERDDAGIVHAINPTPPGEDTFCGRNAADGHADEGGFYGTRTAGPATCPECREAVAVLRDAMRGLRFRI